MGSAWMHRCTGVELSDEEVGILVDEDFGRGRSTSSLCAGVVDGPDDVAPAVVALCRLGDGAAVV